MVIACMLWKVGFTVVLVTLAAGFGPIVPAVLSSQPPAEDGVLPDFELPVPTAPGQRQYLGLGTGNKFKIQEIAAEVVIVEIFSMY